jgi:hypothetical protein
MAVVRRHLGVAERSADLAIGAWLRSAETAMVGEPKLPPANPLAGIAVLLSPAGFCHVSRTADACLCQLHYRDLGGEPKWPSWR